MTAKNILIDLPMPIVTPRLVLRPPRTGDGAAMHAAKSETWDMLQKWMPWAKELGTPDDSESVLREAYAKFILREDIMLIGASRETGKPIVFTGLHRFDWTVRKFEVGYWVRKPAQNLGYASEAANAVTRYAFAALKARKVMISHADGNSASQRVIHKLGFEKQCIHKFDTALPNGDVVSSHEYVMFNTDNLPPLEVTWN